MGWECFFAITPAVKAANGNQKIGCERRKTMNEKVKTPLVREGGAYDSLSALYDEGTFVELGAYVGKTAYAGVVCGYGAVNGALVFAFAQDLTRSGGAIGEDEAEKIVSLYDMAKKSGAPVIGIFEGAGAKVLEGTRALSAFGKIISKVSEISGIVPQIAVIKGVCAGMSAVAASMFDLVIASENASFFINPPMILKAKGGEKDAGSAASAASNGNIDIVCEGGEQAISKARELISLLPQNNAQGLAYGEAGDDNERLTPELEGMSSVRSVIGAICDSGSFTEIKGHCAKEAICGFASLGTISTGIVAIDENSYLTPGAARKIASFVSFCDNYMIPVLTLVNTKGIEPSVDAENAAYAPELARLASAYASSSNAKVTLVCGKAYGAAFTLLGSKAVGADIAYALPCAEISIMAPDAAVQFVYGEEIKAAEDSVAKRKELTEKWISENACAEAAASKGDIDDLVSYELARAKIISAFMMLWAKADGKILKKHTKLPF